MNGSLVLKNLLSILLFLLLVTSCNNDYDFVISDNHPDAIKIDARSFFPPRLSSSLQQPSADTSLYNNPAERINVEAGQVGLPPEIRRVYVTLFSAPPTLRFIQGEIDRRLKLALERSGLDVVSHIPFAQAVINGRIKDFSIKSGESVTNLSDSLIYSIELELNVENKTDSKSADFHNVEDRILVVNTNQYLSNVVVPMLLDDSIEYLSEIIFYGWQNKYSKEKGQSYQILGEKDESERNESSDFTNRP